MCLTFGVIEMSQNNNAGIITTGWIIARIIIVTIIILILVPITLGLVYSILKFWGITSYSFITIVIILFLFSHTLCACVTRALRNKEISV